MSAEIKQWALAVCIAAVAASVLETLIPDKKYEKLIKPIIAAAAVLALISPVKNAVAGCSGCGAGYGGQEISTGLRDTVNGQAAGIVSAAYESAVRQALDGIVTDGCGIEVTVSVRDDGRIYVTGARIIAGERDRAACDLIRSEAARAAGLSPSDITVEYDTEI